MRARSYQFQSRAEKRSARTASKRDARGLAMVGGRSERLIDDDRGLRWAVFECAPAIANLRPASGASMLCFRSLHAGVRHELRRAPTPLALLSDDELLLLLHDDLS